MKAFARVVSDYVRERHEDNQTRAAKHLEVSQAHISDIISGKKGPGLALLLLMRLETGRSIDDMLGFKVAPADELIERLRATFELHVARAQRDAREATEKLRSAEMEIAKLRVEHTPPASDTATPPKSTRHPSQIRRRKHG